jgi:hypothetical protein
MPPDERRNREGDMGQSSVYRIRVRGTLDPEWSAWFEGMKVEAVDGSTSTLTGLRDQAALHGLLTKVRDLGLEIVSVETLDQAPEQGREG